MKKIRLLFIVSLLFGISAIAVSAEVEDYSSTIKMFQASSAVAKFFDKSYGYAVFPRTTPTLQK
jgi:hypothetical protein